jgi:hypothetical protein
MSGFRPADAALEGFRITRENPRTFGAWVAASLAVNVLAAVIDANLPASVKQGLDSIAGAEQLGAQQLLATLTATAPILVLGLAIQSVMAAAVYRLIFRHDQTRFGYLRLGGDELRLMALTVIYICLTIALVVGVSMVGGIVVAISSVAGPAIEALVATAVGVISLCVIIYILVRLSLAPVATFAERRIAVFESWGLTRGQFWPLAGAYALALACIVAIGLLLIIMFTFAAGAFVVALGGKVTDVAAMLKPKDLRSYLSIGLIAYLLIDSVFRALYNAVIAAPGAVAYEALHGAPPQPWTAQAEAG